MNEQDETLTNMTPEEVLKRSRARQVALAIIRRGRDAGIPEDQLRIKEAVFRQLLSPDFHGNEKEIEAFSFRVYNDPDFLLKRKFISIDGGSPASRVKAGYAILFRMIAYDKIGMYRCCGTTAHNLQSIKSTEDMTRNDLAAELKSYDILMLGEFSRKQFPPHFESTEFIDEILGHRVGYSKPTIVTFIDPITKVNKETDAATGRAVMDAGLYLSQLALKSETTNNVLRIRVKAI